MGAFRRVANPLHESFLNERLRQAHHYDRIAGYFRSSIFELAGEAFEKISGRVRVVCNTGLDERDVRTAAGQKSEWYAGEPLGKVRFTRERYERLGALLHNGKVEIRVLADRHFGLIHGKAGVLTLQSGERTCFLGSINETREAWSQHYELLWEDDDPDAVDWVQEEFDALWNHSGAQPLSKAVIAEVDHLLRREVIPIEQWNPADAPSAPFREAEVSREGPGLMPHQKFFVSAVAREVKVFGQARYLLADEVGLGKTVQLAMASELCALMTGKPALILCPKNLTTQWQDEMSRMLGIPSARWEGSGRVWITESGVEHANAIDACPRQIGIVSTSLITAGLPYTEKLLRRKYACVVLDEAHRARISRPLGRSRGEPNNLFTFVLRLAERADSLLLGTATPVQLHRQELYDLFQLLHTACERVLGSLASPWRRADDALDAASGKLNQPESPAQAWRWFSNPVPPEWEPDRSQIIKRIWESLDETSGSAIDRDTWRVSPSAAERFDRPLQTRLVDEFPSLIESHNPFIRHTVKRTREILKNSGYSEPKVATDDEQVEMTPQLEEAYALAQQFCKTLAKRKPGAGILNTLLLRRIGSSLTAGLATATKILGREPGVAEEEDEELGTNWDLEPGEEELLRGCIAALRNAGDTDPKLRIVVERLRDYQWARKGCIVFSQYFDSAWWLAKHLGKLFPDEPIGVYGGGTKCFLLSGPDEEAATRDSLKQAVQDRRLRVLIATEAASEGLNLQKLETLINLDLPWNPARLEQRKGRINRIGQTAEVIHLLNLRYAGSVEDQVHNRLSERLRDINDIFGTLPDMLEDVWVTAALDNIDAARAKIDEKPREHPFKTRYNVVNETSYWDECEKVLNRAEVIAALQRGW